MKKHLSIAFIAALCALLQPTFAAKPVVKATQIEPTKENVVAMAAKYIKICEPKLDFKTQQDIKAIRTQIFMSKGLDSKLKETIDGLVDALTLKLASLKSFNALTVSSAILVQTAPDNARTANLFGSVLHTSNKLDDSVTVLEYALSLKPKSQLFKLNLANAYIDVEKWEKAKSLAESVIAEDSECQGAHKVLSYYWYHKNNLGLFRDELLKASKFKGYVKKKIKNKTKNIQDKQAQQGDSTETLERKALDLQDMVPITTAEIIEEEFPAEAQQIRDKSCKLAEDEQFILPPLPQCNTNTPKDYRCSTPIIEEWAGVFGKRMVSWTKKKIVMMGINPNASKAVIEAQAKAAAKKQMTESMQQAQEMLKYTQNANFKGMTGKNRAELNKALKQLQQVSKQQGIKLEDKPVDMEKIPGFDYGSPIIEMNYRDYMCISRTYELYFLNYYKEYQAKTMDIYKVYGKKVEAEQKHHDAIWEKLQKEHNAKNSPHGPNDFPCRKEMLRYHKALNEISLSYYKQWVSIYMPQYTQKMKPTLDAYYKVCMLYVKNMSDPKVMQREYVKVKDTHMQYASQAGGLISGGGGFSYIGETDEEEAELERDIALAKEEAEAKKPEMEAKFKEPEFDLSKWLEDHFVLEISGEFLSLKVTPKNIEFEAWAFGPGAGIKYDWDAQTLESYTGVGGKLKVGVNVCGLDVGVEGKGDFIRKTAKWDFVSGKYEESYGAKGEVKVEAGAISASGEIQVNTELQAKAAGKISMEGGQSAGSLQWETD